MGIFNFLRPKKVAPTKRLGASGTVVSSGWVQNYETKASLLGQTRYKTFSNILINTSIVAAGVRYFLNLTTKAGWTVEPAEDGGPKAEEIAQQINNALHSAETPWHRVVRRAAMYRFYGFSIQEWTAKVQPDGSIAFLDIEPRPQITIERWDVDDNGKVLGVLQRAPQTQQVIYLPREKLVYLVDDSLNDSPEGLGLFRHIVEPARELLRLEQLEGWGYEVDLRGVPIGRAPYQELQQMVQRGQISEDQKTEIEQGLKNFIEGHIRSPQLGLLLDSITYQTQDEKGSPSNVRKWDVELLKAGSTSQADVAKAIQRKNREIARVLGVENILLGETGAGSLAMARDKSQNFALIVDSTLREIRETFEHDIVDVMMDLNGWPEELRPRLKTESLQQRDVTEVTDALQSMAQAGAVLDPEDPAIAEVRDLLGLSRPIVVSAENAADSALLPKPGKGEPEMPE